MRIFSEMSNVPVGSENRIVGGDLFVPDDMLDDFIKFFLPALMTTFTLKVRREIATSATETSTATPFTFGSRRKSRERIDGLGGGNMTDYLICNVRFDALDGIPICTICRLRQSIS